MVENIRPNPFQPRLEIDQGLGAAPARLKRCETLDFHGSLEARRSDLSYLHSPLQLVFGERRWKAAIAAGPTTIPIRIVDDHDREMARQALIENLQRVNLTLYEEAGSLLAHEEWPWLRSHRESSRQEQRLGRQSRTDPQAGR